MSLLWPYISLTILFHYFVTLLSLCHLRILQVDLKSMDYLQLCKYTYYFSRGWLQADFLHQWSEKIQYMFHDGWHFQTFTARLFLCLYFIWELNTFDVSCHTWKCHTNILWLLLLQPVYCLKKKKNEATKNLSKNAFLKEEKTWLLTQIF